MAEYGLFYKGGREIITRKSFNSNEEAYKWFADLKQMPLDKFKKLFVVTNLQLKNK
jgi:hypothetical protein